MMAATLLVWVRVLCRSRIADRIDKLARLRIDLGRRRWQPATIAMALLLALTGCSSPKDLLQALEIRRALERPRLPGTQSTRPLDFTPEERKQFIDEAGKWRRIELPLIAPNAGAAGWLDERRVVYSTREIVGVWKAAPGELAKVIVFDVDAKTVTETRYRGNLVCFSPERMLVNVPKHGEGYGVSLGMGDQLWGGQFGGDLVNVNAQHGDDIVRNNCEIRGPSTGQSGTDPVNIPLRREHGSLIKPRLGKTLVLDGKAVPYSEFALLDPRGQLVKIFSNVNAPFASSVHYVPWLRAYFLDGGSRSSSQIITPSGERLEIRVPKLLEVFNRWIGSSVAIPSKAGTIWDFVTSDSFWRMQGLYLLDARNELRRIDDGDVFTAPRPVTSADGCRVFYQRREGRGSNARTPIVPVVMNVCQREGK